MIYKNIAIKILPIPLILFIFSVSGKNAPYEIGFQMGYGGQEFKVTDKNEVSGDEFIFGIYGRYMPQNNWGVELGYINGFEGVASILLSTISEVKNLAFAGWRIAAVGEYPIIGNLNASGRLGVAYNQMSYDINQINKTRDSFGAYLAAGLEYQFDFGLGLGLSGLYMPSDKLEVTAVQASLSFRF